MSLVPIGDSDSWSVVLQDSSRQALVLYNRNSGQVSLVNDPTLVHRRGRRFSHDATCPNCGQPLHQGTGTARNDGHRARSNHAGSRNHANGDGDMFRDDSDNSFVVRDANYFQLLEYSENPTRAPSGASTRESTPRRRDSQYTEISDASFSQGYFDKFFVTKAVLGHGSRGTVYLVEHMLDNVSLGMFALKKVAVGDDHSWLEKVLYEVKLLRRLAHKNLVKYNHVWLESSSLATFGPTVPCAYILQEYCNGGTLEDYVFKGHPERTDVPPEGEPSSKRDRLKRKLRLASGDLGAPAKLSLDEILSFMKDVVAGVRHLHHSGVIHRDLKPSNCLLSLSDVEGEFPTVLVSDFGEGQVEGSKRSGTGSTGTLEYCAPELLSKRDGQFCQFSKKTDMFSVGMMLHFLCFSSLPYSDAWQERGDLEALTSEVKAFPGFNLDQSNAKMNRTDIPPQIISLLQRLLSLDPDERPSADETLHILRVVSGDGDALSEEKVQEIPLERPAIDDVDGIEPQGEDDHHLNSLVVEKWHHSPLPAPRVTYWSYMKAILTQRIFWIKAIFVGTQLTLLPYAPNSITSHLLALLIGFELAVFRVREMTFLFVAYCAILATSAVCSQRRVLLV